MSKKVWLWVLTILLIVGLAVGLYLLAARPKAEIPYTVAIADRQAYWFARYNLAYLTMMAGMGPPLPPDDYNRRVEALGPAVGLDREKLPNNPSFFTAAYASGDPHLPRTFDIADWATMRWDPTTMDKTFTPAAQAFTILKTSAKSFHLDYHELPLERWVALMMLSQAKDMAEFLAEELMNDQGFFVPLAPDGKLGEPTALDHYAVLWAFSRLALTASDPTLLLYQTVLGDAKWYRTVADRAFAASARLVPKTPMEKALGIEASGWYAAATEDPKARRQALQAIRGLADQLLEVEKRTLGDLAFAIYGLVEAARITGDPHLSEQAFQLFATKLEALWDPKAGVYETPPGVNRYVYDPYTVGGVLGALNAIRFFATPNLYATSPEKPEAVNPLLAEERYTRFFETLFLKSGLLLATGVAFVPPRYQERELIFHFTHPSLPVPSAAGGQFGRAPVYAGEVTYEGGTWTVTDVRFRTAPAMFLANMSAWIHRAEADVFVPVDRLLSTLVSRS